MHADVCDAEGGALVHHLPEQIEIHHALPAVHFVARTEDAFGVAEVGAFDLDDVGPSDGAVAAGPEEQTADRSGVGEQQPFDRSARGLC
jgi:hypothetical protein